MLEESPLRPSASEGEAPSMEKSHRHARDLPFVVCIIQARMTSRRLPGKVLLELGSATVLEHVIRRCRMARSINDVVVATVDGAESAPIRGLCDSLNCAHVSGSETDVLSRYVKAARLHSADVIVRVTSDCPLVDPGVLDYCVLNFLATRESGEPLDYLSNVTERSFPRGLDVEVFSRDVLEQANRDATDPADHEHVTPYIYRSGVFRIGSIRSAGDWSALRWTLDTPVDLEMFRRLFAEAAAMGIEFLDLPSALHIARRTPEIVAINRAVEQQA